MTPYQVEFSSHARQTFPMLDNLNAHRIFIARAELIGIQGQVYYITPQFLS